MSQVQAVSSQSDVSKLGNPTPGQSLEDCSSPGVGNPSLTSTSIRWVRLIDVFLVLILSLFMCLYETGGGSFGEGDQTTHSLVVQRMVNTGEYFSPQYDGRAYFNKPPFKMWLATIPVRLLGESNFSYRVIDGLSGVGIALAVFLFSSALFQSRLVGYFSVFALLGCNLLFYGHGVRNAVQDSMMLFLMCLGTIAGWYFVQEVTNETGGDRESRSKRRAMSLALGGGLAVGCAVLTKNVPGYYAYVILGFYCLFAGLVPTVLRRGWFPLLCSVLLSVAIPLSYIFSQGENTAKAWQMLVVTEVFKRATKGYHFVNKTWYYWHGIVFDQVTVPPVLLFAAVAYSLFLVLFRRDRKVLFILTWAFVPLVAQTVAKSKLMWYILPSVPALAILVGIVVASSVAAVRRPFGEWLAESRRPGLWHLSLLAFALYATAALYTHMASIASTFVNVQRRNTADETMESIRAHSKASGRTYRAAIFDPPRMTKHETFYWNMIPVIELDKSQEQEFKSLLQAKELDFVVTKLANFTDIAPLRPITGYSVIPPRDRRRNWLGVLSYAPDFTPKHFTPARQIHEITQSAEMFTYGWKGAIFFLDRWVRPSAGPAAGIALNGGIAEETFGSNVKLGLASVIPVKDGSGLNIDFYLNTEKIHALQAVPEGFHEYDFEIPAKAWQQGTNTLNLSFSLASKEPIDLGRQLILLHHLEVALSQ